MTKLRNDEGLVELEPYPVYGGVLGLRVWEGPVRKSMYPIPKTRAEAELLNPHTAKDRGFVYELMDESVFLADHCWNVSIETAGLWITRASCPRPA